MKKVCIVGASNIKNTSFLRKRKDEGCLLISCDGGYNYFLKEGIEPDIFVGDFDTFKKDNLKSPKKIVSLNVKKDDTDTIYAIKKCLKEKYDIFYLYGCTGGKPEHAFANIQTLSFIKQNHANGYLFDEEYQQVLFLLEDESIELMPSKGMLSVFSFSDFSYGVTLKGLMYEIQNRTLTNSFPLGISNQFLKGQTAKIEVKKGKLLIMAPFNSLLI